MDNSKDLGIRKAHVAGIQVPLSYPTYICRLEANRRQVKGRPRRHGRLSITRYDGKITTLRARQRREKKPKKMKTKLN